MVKSSLREMIYFKNKQAHEECLDYSAIKAIGQTEDVIEKVR